MNEFLKKVKKTLTLLVFVLFFIIAIGSVIGFLVEFYNYRALNDNYNSLKTSLGNSNNNNSTRVMSLEQTSKDLNDKITSLNNQNSSLNQILNGSGEITGKISGQIIINNTNISQYQLVCAINISNPSLKYCLTVSSVSQKFALIVPEGSYNLVAQGVDNNGNVLPGFKGYFTQYVQCLSSTTPNCDTNLSKNIVNLDIKSNNVLTNINPIDWKSN